MLLWVSLRKFGGVGVNELLMDNEMNAQNKYLFIALSYLVEEQDKTYKTTIEKLAKKIGTSQTMITTSLRTLKNKELISLSFSYEYEIEVRIIKYFPVSFDEKLNKFIEDIILDGKLRKRQIVPGSVGKQIINKNKISIEETLLVYWLFNNINQRFWVCGLSLKVISIVISKSTQTAKRLLNSINDRMSYYLNGDDFIVYYSPGMKNHYGTFHSLCKLNPVLLGFDCLRKHEIIRISLPLFKGSSILPVWLSKELNSKEIKAWYLMHDYINPQTKEFYLNLIEVILSRFFELSYVSDGKRLKPNYKKVLRDKVLNEQFFSMFPKRNITMTRVMSYLVLIRAAEVTFERLLSYLSRTDEIHELLSAEHVAITFLDESTTLCLFK
ncbi:hypothetical protein AB4615_05580 [Vibrio splendidus]